VQILGSISITKIARMAKNKWWVRILAEAVVVGEKNDEYDQSLHLD
jgi:hypothetical protein